MFAIGDKVWPGISKLMEECGEVVQVCGKLVGTGGEVEHWDGSDLPTRLETELGDLLAAIEFVVEFSGLNWSRIRHHRNVKAARFRAWHEGRELSRWHGYARLHYDGTPCHAPSPRECGKAHQPKDEGPIQSKDEGPMITPCQRCGGRVLGAPGLRRCESCGLAHYG